ncbi:MAG: efflux RND transporter periplasmic adaptor subunit [Candidatus Cloacimonetes bacterium]|nr:efflux RND transporter periplasmic adaptor subunit [Candidatus Cloacimonadota bacterium]
MVIFKRIAAVMAIAVLVFSCSKSAADSGRAARPENKVSVLTMTVSPGNLQRFIKIVGRLEGETDVAIAAEISGRTVSINKSLGEWVNQGESIARINNYEYQNKLAQAEAFLLSAEAAYENAELSMQTSEQLYNDKKISQTEYLQMKSNLKNSLAQLNGAKANQELARKNLENSEFVAPVSGYITELNLKLGELVTNGKIVANIVNSSNLIIKSGVGESDIPFINKGDAVVVEYDGQTFQGKISAYGIKPSSNTGNYPVEIVVKNESLSLLPGMVVEGKILSETYTDVIYISMQNIRKKYDEWFVFVVNDKNKAEIRTVSLGEKVGQNVIILSGIEVGDRLVIDGIDNLDNGLSVDAKTGFKE